MSITELRATGGDETNRAKLERALKQSIEALQTASFSLLRAAELIETALFSGDVRHINFFDEVRRFEISLIQRALNEVDFNQARASQILGINKTTLNSKIKQYSIPLDKRSENTESLAFKDERLRVASRP
jgi:DNA-binding NtrC family response regulator